MFLWLIIKYVFLYPYILLCALLTYYIHQEEKQYYEPLYVTKPQKSSKENQESEKEPLNTKVSIHDEFPCFCKKDKPRNILILFLGIIFLGVPRVIINLYYARKIMKTILDNIKVNKEKENTQEDINFRIKTTKEITSLFLKIAGLNIINRRLPDEKVLPIYQKYFGPEYKIDYINEKFCCYISNHTCVYDMLLSMALFGTGFVAKGALTNMPFIKTMLLVLQSLFVDRSDKNSKTDITELIEERQKDYYEGKPVMPFMIFPEGTTTSGRHILKFKKGTFLSLLPLKATFIHPNLYPGYHLGVGSSDAACNYLISLSRLYNTVEYIELPVLTPNNYMFENFAHLGKEKWEIYAEVVREIMCQLGGFKKNDFGVRDSYRYCSCLKKKVFLERDTYKIE